MATFISHSVAETIAYARRWSAALQPNDVVALTGDLGAGKTQFVKGMAAALASRGEVTSPTFTLVHEYPGGRLPLYHFDFYRIARRTEIEQLGFDEYLQEGGVSVIEWADRFPELLPRRTRWIRFSILGADARELSEENENPRA